MVEDIRNEEKRTIKEQVYTFLNFPKSKEIYAILLGFFILFLMVSTAIIVILETIKDINSRFTTIFNIFLIISSITFLSEYILRVWSSNINPTYKDLKFKRTKYMFSFIGLVDLFSALICISTIIFPIENIFITRFLLLLRLFVLLKLKRYFSSFEIIWAVIKRKREELLMTLILSLVIMFLAAIFIYLAEHKAQPDKFRTFFNTLYWSGITLFTIGFGDLIPVTPIGKLIAGIVSLLGITIFLLPASVIASGFIDETEERYPHYDFCPNCNKKFEESKALKDIRRVRRKKLIEEAKALEVTVDLDALPRPERRKYIVFNALENKYPTEVKPKLVAFFFFMLIGLNAFAVLLESNPEVYQEFSYILIPFYYFSFIVFLIEYVLRIWSCTASEETKYHDPVKGRL
ncbi:MAG: potassium channel family protein [Promethearchaeota archaeon]